MTIEEMNKRITTLNEQIGKLELIAEDKLKDSQRVDLTAFKEELDQLMSEKSALENPVNSATGKSGGTIVTSDLEMPDPTDMVAMGKYRIAQRKRLEESGENVPLEVKLHIFDGNSGYVTLSPTTKTNETGTYGKANMIFHDKNGIFDEIFGTKQLTTTQLQDKIPLEPEYGPKDIEGNPLFYKVQSIKYAIEKEIDEYGEPTGNFYERVYSVDFTSKNKDRIPLHEVPGFKSEMFKYENTINKKGRVKDTRSRIEKYRANSRGGL